MSNETNIHLWGEKKLTKLTVAKSLAKKLNTKTLDISALSMKDLKAIHKDTRKLVVTATKKSKIIEEVQAVYPELGSLQKLNTAQLKCLGAALETWESNNEKI